MKTHMWKNIAATLGGSVIVGVILKLIYMAATAPSWVDFFKTVIAS